MEKCLHIFRKCNGGEKKWRIVYPTFTLFTNNCTKLFYIIIIFQSSPTHNFFNMCIKLSKVFIILNNKLIIALKLSTHSYISVLLQNISWKCVATFIKGFIESPLEKDGCHQLSGCPNLFDFITLLRVF